MEEKASVLGRWASGLGFLELTGWYARLYACISTRYRLVLSKGSYTYEYARTRSKSLYCNLLWTASYDRRSPYLPLYQLVRVPTYLKGLRDRRCAAEEPVEPPWHTSRCESVVRNAVRVPAGHSFSKCGKARARSDPTFFSCHLKMCPSSVGSFFRAKKIIR